MLDFVSTRRDVLRTGGALVVAFTFADAALPALAESSSSRKTVESDEVDGFLSIDADGRVTVYSGKVDLGTGLRTALTQIAAEELDVSLDRVGLIQGDTELTPDQGPTWASLSIQIGGMRIRQAAATARKALVEMAAARLGVLATELRIEDGLIKGGDKSISYAELVGGGSFSLKIDKDVPVKDPTSYTIAGKSVPRLDIPSKVTGRFTYMQDFRIEGMLHGRVIRPLAIGARLESVDETSLNGIPGLIKVVREGNFLGVVATTEWGAIQATRKLKATWSNWEGLPEQARLWDYVRATKINSDKVTANVGDSTKALRDAPKHISATYDFAIHTHGSIGPSCAVVEINQGKITCWSASQGTHRLRRQLAAMMDVPLDNVHCLFIEGSGCYGRNGHEDAAGDAALLSRAVGGKPVRVQWMRADEHGWDPKGPPILVDLRAGVNDEGGIIAWESEFFVPGDGLAPMSLVAATLAAVPPTPITEPYRYGNPDIMTTNSAIPYTFPNIKTVAHLLAETPFRWSWVRSPGRLQNAFANECFVDELAAFVGADPLDFRLSHLNDPRGAELLRRLASLAKWEQRRSPRKSHQNDVVAGRGISYAKDFPSPTYVGAVADIEVDRRSGEIRVQRFFVVHDCGQVINPDGVRNQIEGNIIQTLSRTLKEELLFDRSAVTSLHWATYPILTFPEVPDVIIELVDRPTAKPSGAGEPAAAVVPAAVSNAVFDALGVRLRSVPFTPAKVLAAIESSARRPSREL
ncbi:MULTISPECIES: molybdopterin cofactor-binding domain-containing protein [unclassified Bradyrhizobium]|uniref:xanthine dehydrogenase family protein molybdopterin-binding subunit n=1 Tax=unclassified Bradyrhizobium TaxID=2631580 RepID=UPI00247AAA32|nr:MULTISPECIES: molybdopterin cofactor-binding domain-containing protein [unclassified Bradyrhizobium]WGS19473.1 molybdopterin-dependent oxidoreductase [Bradyrhizobium sp. ISRA463]WGS26311.1 molybdopterin-dependent oxidoreductase [Bradyrhizobium sp. ISRA464]